MLYELLTGELPFRGNKRMLLHQVMRDRSWKAAARRWTTRIPRDLQTICLKAVAKTPARRYSSAGDFAADLRRYLRGEPIQARPVSSAERVVRWARRNPLPAATISLAVMCLVGIAVGATFVSIREREHAQSLAEEESRTRLALEEKKEQYRRTQELGAERALAVFEGTGEQSRLLWLAKAYKCASEAQDLPLKRAIYLDLLTDFGTGFGKGLAGTRYLGEKLLPDQVESVGTSKFSSDGRLLVTAEGNKVVLRDPNDGRRIRPPLIHSGNVLSVAISSNDKVLATLSVITSPLDRKVFAQDLQIWDLETCQPLRKSTKKDYYYTIAFTASGKARYLVDNFEPRWILDRLQKQIPRRASLSLGTFFIIIWPGMILLYYSAIQVFRCGTSKAEKCFSNVTMLPFLPLWGKRF